MYHTSVTLTLLSRCEKVHRVSKLSCESEAVTQGMNLYVCDFDINKEYYSLISVIVTQTIVILSPVCSLNPLLFVISLVLYEKSQMCL